MQIPHRNEHRSENRYFGSVSPAAVPESLQQVPNWPNVCRQQALQSGEKRHSPQSEASVKPSSSPTPCSLWKTLQNQKSTFLRQGILKDSAARAVQCFLGTEVSMDCDAKKDHPFLIFMSSDWRLEPAVDRHRPPCCWLVMLLSVSDTTTPFLSLAHITYFNQSDEHATFTLLSNFLSQSQQGFKEHCLKSHLKD